MLLPCTTRATVYRTPSYVICNNIQASVPRTACGQALIGLSDDDLKELGLKMGQRTKLKKRMSELQKAGQALECTGHIARNTGGNGEKEEGKAEKGEKDKSDKLEADSFVMVSRYIWRTLSTVAVPEERAMPCVVAARTSSPF